MLFDSPLYTEIRPFYPLNFNPMLRPGLEDYFMILYALLFVAGVLLYPIHLYRALRSESTVAAEISVGLVLDGLGVLALPVGILCHAGFILIVAGFFMVSRGLRRIMPRLSMRILSSYLLLVASASLIYLTSLQALGITLEHHISGPSRLSFSTFLLAAYALSLAALAALWPALRLLKRNLGDYMLSKSINLFVIGWILAPLIIPLLISALSYVTIVIRMAHKLKGSIKNYVSTS
ncbi:MAG: hypothetical protein RMJ07_01535 [Nitrososphaerota archaeon]|nr:hypothetical protein [Candidatus Bathyarchaeota archaeon]MDW8048351.1 hypothetical protein [Nitrososphaerota archaeon]